MTKTWSQQFAERFQLNLSGDVRAWLDDELWQQAGGTEFNLPQTPDQLAEPQEGAIWAGFMLPDTIPFVSNEYGDWLCLRVGPDNTIREVIYWGHGGGDWIPYGKSLAEALLYDAAFRLIYSRRPEFTEPEPSREVLFRFANWAAGFVSGEVDFWQMPQQDVLESGAEHAISQLLAANVAQVPVHRDLILQHLESPLKKRSDPQLARQLGAEWEPEFISWMFDTALIPELRKEDLSRLFDLPVRELTQQNWNQAEAHALTVIGLRDDLAWAFDIAGWAAERRGDLGQAIPLYVKGCRASLFADDSVRFRTHWFAEGLGKFAAARLHQLRPHLDVQTCDDPYLNLLWANDPESLKSRVRNHWLQAATQAEQQGQSLLAYQLFYSAGWDLGLLYVSSYHEIFEGLIRNATAANAPALAAVARMHHQHLPSPG